MKFNEKAVFLVSMIVIVSSGFVDAQDKTMYFMGINPAGNMLNPAYTFDRSVLILNPSVDFSLANSSMTFNTMFNKGTGTEKSKLYWDVENIDKNLKSTNFIQSQGSANLLFAGKKLRDGNYISLMISKKYNACIFYPGSFGQLRFGNADLDSNKPRTIDLNNYYLNGSVYNELTFGFSKIVSDHFFAGAHIKLLFGDIGIRTSRFRASIETADDFSESVLETDARIKLSAPIIKTRGEGNELDIDKEELKKQFSLFSFSARNYGTGIDLGFVYKVNERVSLSVSVIDLGIIQWGREPQQLVSKGNYLFDGLYFSTRDIKNFNADSLLKPYTDTLLSVFTPELNDEPFSTELSTKFYLGVKYRLNQQITFKTLLKTTRLYDYYLLEATGGVIYSPWNRWSFSGTWSYSNHSFYNAGLGIVYTGKRLQIYAVTDNLNAIDLRNARGINLAAGINWLIYYSDRPSWTRKNPAG